MQAAKRIDGALQQAAQLPHPRDGREIVISETAHIGPHRGPWLREVARQSCLLLSQGVPLRGVCLYPILGMPDWRARETWAPMGLWDPVCRRTRPTERLACEDMMQALREATRLAPFQQVQTAPFSAADLN